MNQESPGGLVPTSSLPVEGGRQLIRREGEYWTIVFSGTSCRLRDSRGVRHLAHLLAHPHERIAALALERGRDADATDRAAHERARVNVTRALAAALRRLAAHHPELAHHLRATLRTGAFCTYTPDPRVAIGWDVGAE